MLILVLLLATQHAHHSSALYLVTASTNSRVTTTTSMVSTTSTPSSLTQEKRFGDITFNLKRAHSNLDDLNNATLKLHEEYDNARASMRSLEASAGTDCLTGVSGTDLATGSYKWAGVAAVGSKAEDCRSGSGHDGINGRNLRVRYPHC